MNYRITISAAALWAAPLAALGQSLEPVIVTANHYEFQDTEAPYASEVHTGEAIARSGAVSLYDYLQRYSSVTVMPSYGNPFSQKLDMRGFGIGDGYQNIVVTVDGRRMNNIDMTPQLLSAIPVASIDRIEITKGSGSVIYGDGATAGAIHIYTRDTPHTNLSVAGGNHGVIASAVSAGAGGEYGSVTVSADSYHQDGFSDPDITGRRDEATSNNLHSLLRLYPTDWLELRAGGDRARIDTHYPGPLTKAQFDDNPAQNGGNEYVRQRLQSDTVSAGLTADFGAGLSARADYYDEDKTSEFVTWNSSADYEYKSGDFELKYGGGNYDVSGGVQRFEGYRTGFDNRTGKENLGYYLQAQLHSGDTTYAAGARRETVSYTFHPDSGTDLDADHDLSAWDVGVNHRLSDSVTLFANLNKAYQAPDIDRFFTTDWMTGTTDFNTFIEPAESRTLNVGLNRVDEHGKLKLTLFHSELKNEIYFFATGPWSGFNTNIDKSRKSGLELLVSRSFGSQVVGSLNYAYTRARIVEDSRSGGAFNGNTLPGVSDHTATVGLSYTPTDRDRLTLHHTYRSKAYAAEDFGNDFDQRQAAYHSTDVGYSHKLSEMELFVKVDNVLNRSNGLWIHDDAIYPVNFSRAWRVGMRAQF